MRHDNPVRIDHASLTEAQFMWIDTITAVVNQPRFDLKIGDMAYVLGNMIAKMISSAKYYRISDEARNYAEKLDIDLWKPVNVCRDLYGRKKETLIEHTVPVSVIRSFILQSDRSHASVEFACCESGPPAIITRAENQKLTEVRLSRKMPPGWEGIGDNPLKRYESASLTLSDIQVERTGRVCR